jgi:hypothetical protein
MVQVPWNSGFKSGKLRGGNLSNRTIKGIIEGIKVNNNL